MIFELFVIFDIFGIKKDSLDSFSRPVAFVKAAKPITCYSWSLKFIFSKHLTLTYLRLNKPPKHISLLTPLSSLLSYQLSVS